jgi:transcriptional regulator with XRE-family HTH domain
MIRKGGNVGKRKYNHRLLSKIRQCGWQNKDVAKNCGIESSRFSRIITGLREPTQEERQKISHFLRTPQKNLFEPK